MPAYDPIALARLTEINLEDVITSLGWEHLHFGRKLLERPFRYPAYLFARQVLAYDQAVAELGLHAGSQRFLKTLLKDLIIEGQEHIPANGPVLFLANHPGMTDTVSFFASIPRLDLRVVAAERPFLHALPATDRLLIYVSEDNTARTDVLRTVAAQLRAGGAVLTFPAGHIEPDPAVLPGAEISLRDWSNSIGVFTRLAPETTIVPVIASGVLAPKATFHPFTRLRRLPKDRERLGATLQILSSVLWPALWRDLWNVSVRIRFAPPIRAAEWVKLHDPQKITAAVMDQIRPFMCQVIHQDAQYSRMT